MNRYASSVVSCALLYVAIAFPCGCGSSEVRIEIAETSAFWLQNANGDNLLTLEHRLVADGAGERAVLQGRARAVLGNEGVDNKEYEIPFNNVLGSMSPIHVGLVLDASSTDAPRFLDEQREVVEGFIASVLQRGGKAVVISIRENGPTAIQPLSDDQEALVNAIRGSSSREVPTMSLLGAIGLANDELGFGARGLPADQVPRNILIAITDGDDFTDDDPTTRLENEPGIEDLQRVAVNGSKTPVHILGLRPGVTPDLEDALRLVSNETGGSHGLWVEPNELSLALDGIVGEPSEEGSLMRAQLEPEVRELLCGPGKRLARLTVEVTYSALRCSDVPANYRESIAFPFTLGSGECDSKSPSYELFSLQVDHELRCPIEPAGRTVAIFIEPGGFSHEDDEAWLLRGAIEWLSRGADEPTLAVFVDDNAARAPDYPESREYLRDLCDDKLANDAACTCDADGPGTGVCPEPADGLGAGDLIDATGAPKYDVVLFSGGDYPLDDWNTLSALAEFRRVGGGVLLMGDDMTRMWMDMGYDMSPLVGVRYLGETPKSFEHWVEVESYDARQPDAYRVIEHVSAANWRIPGDIDISAANLSMPGLYVLAAARPNDGSPVECFEASATCYPVVVAVDGAAMAAGRATGSR